MIEMVVDSIRVSLMNYQRVVMLKEKTTDRYLPIWIGPAEADAIAVRLQGVSVPRPMTHDLMQSIVDILGGSVNSIVVRLRPIPIIAPHSPHNTNAWSSIIIDFFTTYLP